MSPPVVVKLLSQENMQKMFNVPLHFKLTLHLTLKFNVVPPDSVEVNDDDSQDVEKESEESQVSNVEKIPKLRAKIKKTKGIFHLNHSDFIKLMKFIQAIWTKYSFCFLNFCRKVSNGWPIIINLRCKSLFWTGPLLAKGQ